MMDVIKSKSALRDAQGRSTLRTTFSSCCARSTIDFANSQTGAVRLTKRPASEICVRGRGKGKREGRAGDKRGTDYIISSVARKKIEVREEGEGGGSGRGGGREETNERERDRRVIRRHGDDARRQV